MSASDDFHQLKLRFTDPIQQDYEIIRPIVLFSETVTERSRETGVERTRVGDKARRFVQEGMLGLVDQRQGKAGRKPHEFPEAVAQHIIYLKQLYPPIHYHEIVRILKRKFGYKTNHVTVKNFLARHPIPVQLELNLTEFHGFENAYQARWTVAKLFYEGWNKKSIAECLRLSRKHVHEIVAAFEQDGFAALEDKRTRPATHPENQLTLPLLKEVLDLQREYPKAGRFRVHGLLEKQHQTEDSDQKSPSERTVGRAMALNRQFHGAPGPWSSDRHPAEPEGVIKEMPYQVQYRHQFWFIDIRYLVQREGHWVYSICLIEGYSRMILAGAATDHQDVTNVLSILYAALTHYGCPDMIVSDNGKVFQARTYLNILEALSIQPKYIEPGKPWQNLIEAQFKIQLRLADFKFEQAANLSDIQNRHAAFIETFNTTPHWAHQERTDGRRTPTEVLSWIKGRQVDPNKLYQLFRQVHFDRSVNRHGFVSIQRFYVYAERGLSRQRVSIWIYEGSLRIEYQETLLAQYQCGYDQRQKQLDLVDQPRLYRTAFSSPQLELFELDDEQWLKVQRRVYQTYRKRVMSIAHQLPLRLAVSVLILSPYLLAHRLGNILTV